MTPVVFSQYRALQGDLPTCFYKGGALITPVNIIRSFLPDWCYSDLYTCL